MRLRLRFDPRRARLATRFALASAAILCVGAVVLGVLVSREIETSVVRRVAADSALYVDALLAPYVGTLAAGTLTPADRARLGEAIDRARRGGSIVSVKIWSPEREVLYATDPALVGRRFTSPGLLAALGGSVVSRRSDLVEEENAYERAFAPSLIETYIPLRAGVPEGIVAVAEFYQLPDLLEEELGRARVVTWGVIVVATVGMYVLLAGMVKRGSDTIEWQRERLAIAAARLRELSAARGQTDEEQRRRIARELHDGVTQNLATALLTLGPDDSRPGRLARVAIEAALAETHTLARGLALPQLAPLSLGAVVERACADHERRIGRHVPRLIAELPDGSIALKTAVYRILQEALANSFRHAREAPVEVRVGIAGDDLVVTCADHGPGISSDAEGLGIRGMRERAELLGGRLEVSRADGGGTAVRATLPLAA